MIHLSAVLAILMLGVAVAETIGPVAGLMPDVRPPGAPVIVSVERTANWQAQALKGISAPQTAGVTEGSGRMVHALQSAQHERPL